MGLLTVPTTTAPQASAGGASRGRPVPAWLDAIVRNAAFGVVAVGLVGVPLALTGDFRRLPLAVGSGCVFVLLIAVWARWTTTGARYAPPAGAGGTAVALLAVALAVGFGVVNALNNDQHLLVDGDPAVYAATGALLAHHGGLTVPTHAATLFGGDPTLNFAGAGFFPSHGEPTVYPQFFHLLPVLLALGRWAGGIGGLLEVGPVLGALAVLAIYAFAARVVRPPWALLAAAIVAVLLPQLHFSRDTFSEVPSEFLVFAGLAMVWDVTGRRRPHPRALGAAMLGGFAAGLVFGGGAMARVDAVFYLAPLAAALVVMRAGRVGAAVFTGALAPTVVAVADGYWGSPAYLDSVRGPLVETAAALAVIGLAALVARRWPRLLRPLGPGLAGAAAGLLVAAAAFAWFGRPYVEVTRDIPARTNDVIAGLQRMEGLPVDVPRAYDELTMRWLSWYLGPVALALGVLGLAFLLYRLLRGRDLRLAPFVLLTGAVTAVYVWRPGIFPVQYWATRRFLPVSFPGLALLAAWLCSWLWQAARARSTPVMRVGGPMVAGGLGLAALALPVALLPGATLVRNYRGLLPAVHRLCAALAPADVVLLMGGPPVTTGFPQLVEAYCHNPAASIGRTSTAADVARVATATRARGRPLVLLSSTASPGLAPAGTAFRRLLDLTVPTEALSISHRPDDVYPDHIEVFIARLPAPSS